MTAPIQFSDEGSNEPIVDVPISEGIQPTTSVENPYPAALIKVDEARMNDFRNWVRKWVVDLVSEFSPKQAEWSDQEKLYRARGSGPKSFPFQGACGDIIPVMAMAVDPVHARLENGIFKADPVFTVKALKKSYSDLMPSVNRFVDYYQHHRLKLRQVCSPRFLECAKHGTMVYKTSYDREVYRVQTYDKEWKVISKDVTRFSGPRVFGVHITNFMFPAGYEHIQQCPIVLERQRPTFAQLKILEASGKLVNVDAVKDQGTSERTLLELEREHSANQIEIDRHELDRIQIIEGWCEYDINGDGLPEKLVFTYHYDTDTFLQLRYNWYFHQRYPYTVIPYTITNDSIHGLGLGEMSKTFQEAITQWHQMATDNAYLANIRMFIASKDAQIENNPRLWAGRVFRVNDPGKDLIPFKMSDTYGSTLQERQNLFGLVEKRSGISDYLTGRESPIVGSRATATSTLALIDEGTKRVEQTMENIRRGMAEIMENCMYIWMQYGLDDIDDIVFGDDQVATDVRAFFNTITQDNINGAVAITLTATDAKANRAAKQQMQLAVVQVMMNYYKQLVELGSNAIQSASQMPALSAMLNDVAESSRKMFKDLLRQYDDIIDPDEYLPQIEEYIRAATAGGPAQQGGAPGQPGDAQAQPGVPGVPVPSPGVPGGLPPGAPQGGGFPPRVPFAG